MYVQHLFPFKRYKNVANACRNIYLLHFASLSPNRNANINTNSDNKKKKKKEIEKRETIRIQIQTLTGAKP